MRLSSLFISLLFVFSFLSCRSSTDSSFESEPEWMSVPPAEETYYYGIGGSNGGVEAEDREIAISRAQSNLAASISVDIISELELNNLVDNNGSSSETLKSRIHQSVSQSLVNVETLDNWYHPNRGYWVLLRMDKTQWEKQRSADRRVSVPVPTGLEVHSGYNIPFLAILSNMNLPLQFLPGGKNTAFEITLDWVASDYPVIEESGGIHFTKLSGIISFKQYGLVLVSREYGPVKEGGLNYEQARERGADRILDEMRSDAALRDEIIRALPK